LPSLLYASFLSYFHGFYFLNGFAVAQTFVVLSLLQLFRLNQNEDGRRVVFNAAFFLGVASTFYPFMIIAFPFMFWMIWVIRPFIFRESIIALFGYIIPFLYAGVFNYMIGHRLGSEEFSSSSFEFKKIDMIFLFSVLFILAVLSLQGISRKFQKSSIRLKKLFRKTFLMISFISALSALEYLFFRKIEPISLLFIPLTFVIPFGFGEKEPKTLPSLLYYVLIIFAFGKFFIPLNQ
jgi:hypothetical protein